MTLNMEIHLTKEMNKYCPLNDKDIVLLFSHFLSTLNTDNDLTREILMWITIFIEMVENESK